MTILYYIGNNTFRHTRQDQHESTIGSCCCSYAATSLPVKQEWPEREWKMIMNNETIIVFGAKQLWLTCEPETDFFGNTVNIFN